MLFSVIAQKELRKWYMYQQLKDTYDGQIVIAGQDQTDNIDKRMFMVWYHYSAGSPQVKALMYLCNDPMYYVLFGDKIPNKTALKNAIDVMYQDNGGLFRD